MGPIRHGNPPVRSRPMRVVVVSSVRAGSWRPSANSRVVLPPPPTRATSDRRPSSRASAAPARSVARTNPPVGQISRILRASTTAKATRAPRTTSRLSFFTARSVVGESTIAARRGRSMRAGNSNAPVILPGGGV